MHKHLIALFSAACLSLGGLSLAQGPDIAAVESEVSVGLFSGQTIVRVFGSTATPDVPLRLELTGPDREVRFTRSVRRLGIKVITAASNLSSDLGIKDTQSGFRAFSRTALERLRFDSEGMELSLEMLEDAHEKQLRVLEVPTVIRYDVPKGSNFTAVSHGFTVMTWAVLSLSQKKPLLVLGLPGFGLLATGAAMGTRTAQDFTLQLDNIIGAGFSAVWIGLLGLSLMATGLVLQSAQRFLRLLLVREFGLD